MFSRKKQTSSTYCDNNICLSAHNQPQEQQQPHNTVAKNKTATKGKTTTQNKKENKNTTSKRSCPASEDIFLDLRKHNVNYTRTSGTRSKQTNAHQKNKK